MDASSIFQNEYEYMFYLELDPGTEMSDLLATKQLEASWNIFM